MKKMIDLIAESGTGKDEKLLNYIRKNYLINNYVTNLCFISGQGNNYGEHNQLSADELRKLVFEKNDKNTIYFLRSFFFDKDRDNYLKLIEEICMNDIQVFKTDQKKEHISSDESWNNKYVEFKTLDDMK